MYGRSDRIVNSKRMQSQSYCKLFFVVHNLSLSFRLWDVTAASKQQHNTERWNDIDGLASALAIFKPLVGVARLTLCTLE